jgi:predicted proteasome-type protease
MNIDEANGNLASIQARNNDTVYCEIKENHYGKPMVVHLDGCFTLQEIRDIAETMSAIETEKTK